jgi:hypothetical protein
MPNWVKCCVYARNHKALLDAFKGKNAYGEEKDFTFNKVVPMPEDVYREPVGADSPANNWFNFNISHWGTKWDCCEARDDGECVVFETAWSCPDAYLSALAGYLGEPVVCAYADEDTGNNCGCIIYFPDGGNNEIDCATLFANMLWDGDLDFEWLLDCYGEEEED